MSSNCSYEVTKNKQNKLLTFVQNILNSTEKQNQKKKNNHYL